MKIKKENLCTSMKLYLRSLKLFRFARMSKVARMICRTLRYQGFLMLSYKYRLSFSGVPPNQFNSLMMKVLLLTCFCLCLGLDKTEALAMAPQLWSTPDLDFSITKEQCLHKKVPTGFHFSS